MNRPRGTDRYYGDALSIYWTTDIHLRAAMDGNPGAVGAVSGYKYYYDGGRRLQAFVDAVNTNKPHLAMATGDLVDTYSVDNFNLFNSKWTTLDASVKKELTLGNHDLDQAVYSDVVSQLGYTGRTVVANSHFNTSFSISNSKFGAKVLVVDTNIDATLAHVSTTIGALQQDALDWIQSEALAATEKVLLIFSHHAPHMVTLGWFDAASAAATKAMLDAVIADRPGMKIIWFSGHLHGVYNADVYTTYGGSILGIRGKCSVDHNPGSFNKILVFPDGSVQYLLQSV